MNIYEFFNSRDIAEYCRNINHKFSAIESAYIVWQSNHHTLTDKHKAWQEIIDTMPDEQLPDNYWINDALHDFLRSIIKLQSKFIQDFISTKGAYVYTVSNLNKYSGHHFTSDWFFSSYKACLNSVKKTISKNYYEVIKISRYELHASSVATLDDEDTSDGCDALLLNEKLAVLDIETADYDAPNDERFYLNPSFVFEAMPISIPSPFYSGDIVKDVSEHWLCCDDKPPFVVESYPLMPNGSNGHTGVERHCRSTKGWFQASDGDILWCYGDDYLNLVRHEPKEKEEEFFLLKVSDYLKESISAEMLMQHHEEYLKTKRPNAMLSELIRKEEQRREKCIEKKQFFENASTL